jgi:hypothetical protein
MPTELQSLNPPSGSAAQANWDCPFIKGTSMLITSVRGSYCLRLYLPSSPVGVGLPLLLSCLSTPLCMVSIFFHHSHQLLQSACHTLFVSKSKLNSQSLTRHQELDWDDSLFSIQNNKGCEAKPVVDRLQRSSARPSNRMQTCRPVFR